ncbi:MAG: DUF6242 domain-containing protein, partial [Neisseriaceae bacterium]
NTNVESLVAVYKTTGVSVSVNSGGKNTVQTSGHTRNNFSKPVTYIVKAANGSTDSYRVTVTKSLESENTMVGFSLKDKAGIDHPGIVGDGVIEVDMPYGTDVKSLISTFEYSGSFVEVNGVRQISGEIANDFTNPVTYNITAYNSNVKSYTVIVKVGKSSSAVISYFGINGKQGVQVGHNINVSLPYGTDVASLVSVFNTDGEKVTVNGAEQKSGETVNNFTNPVVYTAHAYDGITTVDYTVTVNVESDSTRAITKFSINGYTGNIDGNNISVDMPSNTNVSDLIATFEKQGTKVTVSGVEQFSGFTHNDFTSPVTYTVHAADDKTTNYTVTVNLKSSEKTIKAFSLDGYHGDINGNNITVVLPNGYSLNDLTVEYDIGGAQSVTVDGQLQANGGTRTFTAQSPVTYTVHAADGSSANYTVTVKNAPSMYAYMLYPYVSKIYTKEFSNGSFKNIGSGETNVYYNNYHVYSMIKGPSEKHLIVGQYGNIASWGHNRFMNIIINSDGSLKAPIDGGDQIVKNTNSEFTSKMVIGSNGLPDGSYLYQIFHDQDGWSSIDKNTMSSITGKIEFADGTQLNGVHDFVINPGGDILYATYEDNLIAVYNRDLSTGTLSFRKSFNSGGWFPNHIAITPDNKFVFVANDGGMSGDGIKISVSKVGVDYSLTGLYPKVGPSSTAKVVKMLVNPNGKYLYAAWNMGDSTIKIITYRIDVANENSGNTSVLTNVGELKSPYYYGFSMSTNKSGTYLAVGGYKSLYMTKVFTQMYFIDSLSNLHSSGAELTNSFGQSIDDLNASVANIILKDK